MDQRIKWKCAGEGLLAWEILLGRLLELERIKVLAIVDATLLFQKYKLQLQLLDRYERAICFQHTRHDGSIRCTTLHTRGCGRLTS